MWGCGQNLQHVTRCNPHFKCPRKFNAANQDCVTDNLYDDEFNEMIFRAIKLFAKISDDAEPVLELQKAELKSKVNGAAKRFGMPKTVLADTSTRRLNYICDMQWKKSQKKSSPEK